MSNDTEVYPQLTPAKLHRWDTIERGLLAGSNITATCITGTLAGLTHNHLLRGAFTIAMLWSIAEFTRILVSPR